ncbi:hypothetical protein BD410DRAFT_782189 [Rickenella mellea]|uniref:Mediator of RNA polymerase II transcription subunit 7 n=1 Tax=Rickenella mellea TaxID=50990 RepID=A0A4Y7QMY5_9AGAM|nr:hypothetical protein BD410DRAFT_782189 [Rickenella mellea]
MEEDEDAELRNPFPSPPSHYKNYTSRNLELLGLLKSRSELSAEEKDQQTILSDQSDVPDWPLVDLEKPRVDWIIEEGSYTVYGDTWFVKENVPSLGELGGRQLYPADPTVDRRPALVSILRTLLATFSSLLSSVLAPPPTATSNDPPDWQRHIEWMTVMGQNIMSAANDLRPVQARDNLESLMKRQLELRRQETQNIHLKCNALETRLAELKSAASHPPVDRSPDSANYLNQKNSKPEDEHASLADMHAWAEQV